jgi:hypothetical protein
MALSRGTETTVMSGSDGADAGLDGRAVWAVVGALALCLVGAPLAILVWPPTFLSFVDAYIALSMVPALALGAVGVWTALRAARDET